MMKIAKILSIVAVAAGVFYLNMNYIVSQNNQTGNLQLTQTSAHAFGDDEDDEPGVELDKRIVVSYVDNDQIHCADCYCTETWVTRTTCPSGGSADCTPGNVPGTATFKDPKCN